MTVGLEPPRTAAGWLDAAQGVLGEYSRALSRYGVEVDGRLRLVEGDDPNPYYEIDTMTIGVGMPDPETVKGRLHWPFLARYWGGRGVESGLQAMAVQLPFLMAHEVTHHVRHVHGALMDNDFIEEQVVNEVALAFVREHELYSRTVPELVAMAERAAAKLSEHSPGTERYLAGFRLDEGEVLVAQGALDPERIEDIRALAASAGVTLDEAIESSGLVSGRRLSEARAARAESEAYFNRRYMANLVEYASFFEQWLPAYLARGDLPTLAEALERHVLTENWEATRREQTLMTLETAVRHPVDQIAAAAAEMLGVEAGERAAPVLHAALRSGRPEVEAAALRGLARVTPADPRLLEAARERLDSSEPALRAAAAAAQTGAGGLARLLAGDREERLAAFHALRDLPRDGMTDGLLELLSSSDPEERRLAALALERAPDAEALPGLTRNLGDPSRPARETAKDAIRALGAAAAPALLETPEPVEALLLLQDWMRPTRSRACAV